MNGKLFLTGLASLMLAVSCTKTTQTETAEWQTLSDGITTLTIDSMTVITLRDNAAPHAMPNRLFYGEKDSALVEQLSPEGGVPASIHTFLVQLDGQNILFDTGNGTAVGGQLLARLDSIGIAPADIDYLMITHFHGDHIGGMLLNGTATFANAQVYVPAAEYDFWVTNGDPAGQQAVTMAAYAGRLHRFAPNDVLPCGIVPLEAVGHTPGHTAFRMGRFLVIGDLMHGAAIQLPHPELCAAYDMDRETAIATRKKFLEYIQQENLIAAGMHLPDNGILK